MKIEELEHLKADRRLQVRHGRGTVAARFCRFSTTKAGVKLLVVQKFHWQTNHYGNPVRITAADVVSIY